jgi:hypothetical protein
LQETVPDSFIKKRYHIGRPEDRARRSGSPSPSFGGGRRAALLSLLLQPFLQRTLALLGWSAGKDSLYAYVFIQLRPVDPLSVSNQLVVFPFFAGTVKQARIPGQGD